MISSWLNLIDIGCITATFLFALSGFQKGFARQVSYVITFLFYAVLLFFAYPVLFNYLAEVYYQLSPISLMWYILIAATLLSVGVYFLIHSLMTKYLKTKLAVGFDKTFGVILGFIRGASLALLILIVSTMVGSTGVYNAINSKSTIGHWVCENVLPQIQPEIKRVSLEAKVNKLRDRLLEGKGNDTPEPSFD